MKRETIAGLASGVAMALVVLGAAFLRKLGLIDGALVTRVGCGITGVWMVWYGNRLPKIALPLPRGCAGRARRVSAWSMVLSGLLYAALWIFAPIPVATVGGVAVVLAGIVVTLAYCMRVGRRARPLS